MLLHQIFEATAVEKPHRHAIEYKDEVITYGELNISSNHLALYLQQICPAKRAVVAICVDKEPLLINAILAVLKAGMAWVPLPLDAPRLRIQTILDVAKPATVLTAQATEYMVKGLCSTVTLDCDEVVRSIAALPPNAELATSVKPDDLCHILFTSGSTGIPKGVMIEHQAVVHNVSALVQKFQLGEDTRTLQFAAYTFDIFGLDVFMTFMVGGCLILDRTAEIMLDATRFINRAQITYTQLTPTVISLIDSTSVPSLRVLASSGEALTSGIVRKWRDRVRLFNAYGPTETIVCTIQDFSQGERLQSSFIGSAVEGLEVVLMQRDSVQDVDSGDVGEICVAGIQLFRGYLGMDHEDSGFCYRQSQKFYRTGDLGTWTQLSGSDRTLNYLGRKDNQVKVNGVRLDLGEVEQALGDSPVVHHCVAFIPAIGPAQGKLTVVVSLEDDHELHDAAISFTALNFKQPSCESQKVVRKDLIDWMTEMVSPAAVPTVWWFTAKLPLTSSGKIDRMSVRKCVEDIDQTAQSRYMQSWIVTVEHDVHHRYVSDTQQHLASLCGTVMNLEPHLLDINTPLIQLGFDSLSLMRFVSLARDAGFDLSLQQVLRDSTIALISSTIGTIHPLQLDSPTGSDTHLNLLPVGTDAELLKASAAEQCHLDVKEIADIYPCTPLQAGMMALAARTSGAYVCEMSFLLPLDVDPERLRSAWDQLMAETSLLRNRIIQNPQGKGLLQATVDSHAALSERDSFMKPMSIGDSLCRAQLTWDNDLQQWRFKVKIHHALFDGWSKYLMLDELRKIYHDQPRSPDSGSFRNFVAHLVTEDDRNAADHLRFWADRMKNCPVTEFPALPPDWTGQLQSYKGYNRVICLAIANLAKRYGVTPTTFLHTAWAIVLGKHAAAEDVVFGITLAGRDAPVQNLEGVIGPTMTTVPCRAQIGSQLTVQQLTQQMHQQYIDMIPHKFVGLNEMTNAGSGCKNASAFRTLLVVQPDRSFQADHPDFLREETPLNSDLLDTYPLTLELTPGVGSLEAKVHYDPTLTTTEDLNWLLGHFENVLAQLGTCDLSHVATDLEVCSQMELERLRSFSTTCAPKIDLCLHDLIGKAALKYPRHVAITQQSPPLSITYADLDQWSTCLANHLHFHYGVGPGDIIPISFVKSAAAIVSMLSILKTGAAYAPVDATQPLQRISDITKSLSAKFALCSAEYASVWKHVVEKVLGITDDWLYSLANQSISAGKLPLVSPTDDAMVFFTSGSTGQPKGVVSQHFTVCTSMVYVSRMLQIQPGDRTLQFTPFTFDMSLKDIYCTLLGGGTICMPDLVNGLYGIPQSISSMNVNVALLTPTIAAMINPQNVPKLRMLNCGGERLNSFTIELWASRTRLINTYGPTETIACVTAVSHVKEDADPDNIGHDITGRTWLLQTDSQGALVLAPMGCTGQIAVSGHTVARGYLNDQQKTEKAFVELPGWMPPNNGSRLYLTGDLGIYGADGTIKYVGRNDQQIKISGIRTEPTEVEFHLRQLGGIFSSAVVAGVPEKAMNSSLLLAAFVIVPQADQSPPTDANSIFVNSDKVPTDLRLQCRSARDHLATKIPSHMVPSLFIPLSRAVLTTSHKTDRKRIVNSFESDDLRGQRNLIDDAPEPHPHLPQTDHEKLLHDAWKETLGRTDDIHLGADFFSVGGDSFTAVRLVSACRKRGIKISVGQIYECSTIDRMAKASTISTDTNKSAHPKTTVPFSLVDGDVEDLIKEVAETCHLCVEEIEDIYPTTPFQEGLAAASLSDDASYMAHWVFAFDRDVDISLLQAAIERVVAQNPIMRTVLAHTSYGTVQIVKKHDPDISDTTAQREHDGGPTNNVLLEGGSLFSYKFLGRSATKPCLEIKMHHVLYDEWVINSIMDDIAYNYTHPSEKREGKLSFANYIQHCTRADVEEAAEFWRKELDGSTAMDFPSSLELRSNFRTDASIKSRSYMRSHSSRCPHSIATVGTASLALLSSWYCRSKEAIFGITLSGRDIVGLEEVVGPTIATVPFRVQIEPPQRTSSFLSNISLTMRNVQRHQRLGLQEIARLGDGPRGACSLRVLFVVQQDSNQGTENGDLNYRLVDEESSMSLNFALVVTLITSVANGTARFRLQYDSRCLTEQHAQKFLQELEHLTEYLQNSDSVVEDISNILDGESGSLSISTHGQLHQTPQSAGTTRDNGHKDRKALPRRHPQTSSQKQLRMIWANITGVKPGDIYLDDNLQALGADSISLIRLFSAIRKAGFTLFVGSFTQSTTLAELAAVLETSQMGKSAAKIPSPFSLLDANKSKHVARVAATRCFVEQSRILDVYPCTSLQEGLMALSSTLSGAYLMQHLFEIVGEFDLGRMTAALRRVWRKNAILRTRIFLDAESNSLQAVLDERESKFRYHEGVLDKFLEEDQKIEFEYGRELSRAALVCDPAGTKYLVLSQNHAVGDGWATKLLVKAIQEEYGSTEIESEGEPVNLIPAFIKHVKESECSPVAADFWKSYLDGTVLPSFPFTTKKTYRAAQWSSVSVDISMIPNSSVATLLEAVWGVVLSRYADSDDVCFGVVRSGRSVPIIDIDNMTGPTIATIPRRFRLLSSTTVSQYLERVQSLIDQATPYEHYGLQNIAKLSQSAKNACAFQTLLTIHSEKKDEIVRSQDGPAFRAVEVDHMIGSYCLSLDCEPQGNGMLLVSANYDDSAVSDRAIEWLLYHLSQAILQISSNPDLTINEISIAGPRDQEQVIAWNRVTSDEADRKLDEGTAPRERIWVVDRTNHSRLAPIGCPGKLLLSGPSIVQSHLDNQGRPEMTFVDASSLGWRLSTDAFLYDTGDTVRQELDGSLVFISSDKVTKPASHDLVVEVSKVELFLEKFGPLSGAIADVVRSQENDDSMIVALVTIHGQENEQAQLLPITATNSKIIKSIQVSLLARFPRHLVPQHILPVGKIPLTSSGKIDRKGLNQLYQSAGRGIVVTHASDSTAKHLAPSESLQILRRLWADVLQIDSRTLRADDDFFIMGGDSVVAIRLASHAKQRGYSLPAKAVIEHSGLEEMALQMTIPKVETHGETSLVDKKTLQIWYNQVAEVHGIPKGQIEDIYPCTPAQVALIAATLRNPQAYIAIETFQLSDSIDMEKFRQAWQSVYHKNEMLRARICQVYDLSGSPQLVQVICSGTIEWSLKDNATPTTRARGKIAMGLGEPLSGFALYKTSNGLCFRLTRHHSIYDGWSTSLLWNDFRRAYATGEPPVSRPPFRSYVQYVQDQAPSASEVFWRQQLEGYGSEHYPKLPSKDVVFETNAHQSLTVPCEHHQRGKATFANIARAAWALTISAVSRSPSDSHDICFGAVVSGRLLPIPGIEEIPGPTMNTVPIRIQIDTGEPVDQYLARISQQATAMMPFEYTGLSAIGKLSHAAKSACGFSNLLVVQPAGSDNSSELQGVTEIQDHDQMRQPYGFMVQCREAPDGSEIYLEASYDGKVLGEEEVRLTVQLLSRVITLLTQAQSSNQSIQTVLKTLNTERDYEWMLSVNGPALPASHLCLHHLVENSIGSFPQRVAISAHDQQLTYEELDKYSSRIALHLQQAYQIGPESLVPILFEKSSFMIVAMLAVLKAGAGYVPLDPTHPESRLRYVVGETNAKMVLTSAKHSAYVGGCIGAEIFVVDHEHIKTCPTTTSWTTDGVTQNNVAYVIFTSGSTGRPKGVVIEHGSASLSMIEHARVFGHDRDKGFRTLQFCSYTFDVSVAEIFSTLAFGGTLCIPTEQARLNDLAGVITSMNVDAAFLTPTVAQLLCPEDVPSLSMLCMAGEPLTQALVKTWTSSVDGKKRRVFNGYGPTEGTVECAANLLQPNSVPYDIGSPFGGQLWIVDSVDYATLLPVGCIGELVITGAVLAREYLHDSEKTSKAFVTVPWLEHTESKRAYRTGDLARYTGRGTIEYLGRRDIKQVKLHGLRIELGEIESAILSSNNRFVNVVVEKLSRSGHEFLTAFLQLTQNTTNNVADVQTIFMSPTPQDVQALIQDTKSKLRLWLPEYMVPALFLPVVCWPQSTSGKTDRRTLREAASNLTESALDMYRDLADSPRNGHNLDNGLNIAPRHVSGNRVESNSNSTRDQQVSLGDNRRVNGTKPTLKAKANKTSPKSSTELRELVTQFWRNILHRGLDFNPQLHDDFFRLGGDSIAAIFLVAEFRKNNIQTSVGELYDNRTLDDMIRLSERGSVNSIEGQDLAFSLLDVRGSELDDLKSRVAQSLKTSTSSIEDIYPCTPLQEGIMFLTEKVGGSYHGHFKTLLPSTLDMNRFFHAWTRLTELHQILRTRICFDEQFGSLQVVDTTAHHIQAMQKSRISDTIRFGYGLPLYQYYLQAEGDRMYFHLEIHHSIYDGWSMPVLIDDLARLYRDIDFAPASTPFTNLVSYLQTQSVAAQGTAFWEEYLKGAVISDFPELAGKAHHAVRATAHQTYELAVEPNSLPEDVTMATICKAAWAFVISKYTSSDDVCFGLVLSGRNAPVPGVESIRGPTINTVALRVILDPEMSTLTLLRQVQTQVVEMVPHQFVSLTRLQRMFTDGARHFGSLLLIQPPGLAQNQGTDFTLNTVGSEDSMDAAFFGDPYPLLAEVNINDAGNVKVAVQFDPDVVSKAQLDLIMSHYELAIQGFSSEPSVPVKHVSMLSELDEQQLLQWAGEPIVKSEDSVVDMISRAATLYTHDQAIEGFGESVTYSELERRAHALAYHLTKLDPTMGPSSIVPVWMETSPVAIITLLAILKTGASYVPLDARLPVAKAQHIVRDVHATIMVVSQAKLQIAQSLDIPNMMVLEVKQDLMQGSGKVRPNLARCNELAYVIYTSGTTGLPKGVMMEHWALAATVKEQAVTYQIGHGTRMFGLANLSWDPSLLEIFVPLSHGGCLCIPTETERNEDLVGAINRMRADQISTSPAVASLIDLRLTPTVTIISLGGECIREENIQNAHEAGVRLFNIYGPSEACIDAIVHRNMVPGTRVQNVGQPMSSQAWIVDVQDPTILMPPGCVGEIALSGTLARGYLNDPEKTAKSFLTNCAFASPVYLTGDLGRFSADGSVFFLGRKDRQVKLNGQRVELGEIEAAVEMALPGTKVIVDLFAVGDKKTLVVYMFGGRNPVSEPVKVVSRMRSDSEKFQKLQSSLKSALPRYMIPYIFVTMSRVPLSSSSKVDFQVLREAYRKWFEDSKKEVAKDVDTIPNGISLTASEVQLQGLWASALGLEEKTIHLNDNFFDLGGDSLNILKLTAKAAKIGLRISVTDVYASPTLSAMSEALQHGQKKDVDTDQDPAPFSLVSQPIRDQVSSNLLSDVVDILPCTTVQTSSIIQGLKWHRSYHAWFIYRVNGEVDDQRLRSACQSTMQRHDVLRTSFTVVDGQLFQAIHNSPLVDFRRLDPCNSHEDLCSLLDRDVPIPVGLDMVMTRYRISKDTHRGGHLLALGMSHAQYDGFCFNVFANDLYQAYHQRDSYQPPRPSYSRFISHMLQSSNDPACKHFWTDLLTGSSMTMVNPHSGSHNRRLVDGVQAQTMSLFQSRPENVTFAMVSKAAWAIVLSLLSGTQDVVFGSLVFGRGVQVSRVDEIVGACMNVVPSRIAVTKETNVAQLLNQIKEQQLSTVPFETTPLEVICQRAGWSTNTRFGSIVQHQNIDESTVDQGQGAKNAGSTWDFVGHAASSGLCDDVDCWITTEPLQNGYRLSFWHNEAAIPIAVASNIAQLLCDLITNIHTNADRPISALLAVSAVDLASVQIVVPARHQQATKRHRRSLTKPLNGTGPVDGTTSATAENHSQLTKKLGDFWTQVLPQSTEPIHPQFVETRSTTPTTNGTPRQNEKQQQQQQEPDSNASFFDLGGDSLSATQLSVLYRNEGIKLSVQDVFDHPTLRQQVDYISKSEGRTRKVSEEDREDDGDDASVTDEEGGKRGRNTGLIFEPYFTTLA